MRHEKNDSGMVLGRSQGPESATRRTLLKAAAAGAAILAAPMVGAKEQKTIRFLNDESSRASVEVLQNAAQEYEKIAGVKVVIDTVTPDAVFQKLQAAISAGNAYDIGTLAFTGDMLVLQAANKLVPLTKLVNKHKWGPRILFPIHDEVWWYPYDYNFCWLYYRKDLYKKNGLKVPDTWDEMIHNSKVLTADNMFGASQPIGANEAAQWMSLGYMWADGVRMLDDNFKLILDNAEMKPKVAGFLDMMKALYPTMPPGMIQAVFSTVLGQFSGRQVAHAPYAGRLMEVLEQRAPDLADQTGFFMYPDSAGKHKAVNHGYDGWVVLNTPRQDLSLKFMEWFTENRYIDFLHSAPLHFQPARMDIYDNPRWRNNPLIKKHADLVEFMKSILTRKDVIIRSVDTEGPRVDLRPAKMFQTYAIIEAIQDRLLKNMPADQAVEKAAAKYRKVL